MRKALLLIILLPSFASAFAGFTTDKGKYDFNPEYEFEYSQNRVKNNIFFIGNEFGITENTSVGFNASFEKENKFFTNSSFLKNGSDYTHYEFFTTSNLIESEKFELGVRNLMRFFGEGETGKSMFYEVRVMTNFLSSENLFGGFGLDVAVRRNFSGDNPDELRIEPSFTLNFTEKLSYFTMLETAIAFASEDYLKSNLGASDVINSYSHPDFKFAKVVLYTGPSYSFNDSNTAYLRLRFNIAGEQEKHTRGFVIGHSYSVNLQ